LKAGCLDRPQPGAYIPAHAASGMTSTAAGEGGTA
jgi:hypothetical protein